MAEVETMVQIVSNKPKFYQTWKFWLILVVVMLVSVGIIFAILFATSMTPKNNKSSAVQEIGHVFEKIVNGSNVTDYMTELRASYDSFDDDNDGYWNADEFSAYLQSTESAKDVFKVMDVNGDNILSFREMMATLLALDKIPPVSDVLQKEFGYIIMAIWNYSYAPGDLLWFQYTADLIFDFYDAGYSGYITIDAFYDFRAESLIKSADQNGDGVIDFDEFVSDIFENEKAISMVSHSDVLHLSDGYNLTLNDTSIEELDFNMCPSINIDENLDMSTAASIRRRLISLGTCVATVIACGVVTVFATVCCATGLIVTAGASCLPCVVGAVVTCSTALGTCSVYGVEKATGACFAGSNMLLVDRDGIVSKSQLNEIKIGDYVLSKDGWTKVWFINYHYGKYDMIDLYYNDEYNYNDDNLMHISLTADHLLYVNGIDEQYMKRADEVQIGDTIFTVDGINENNIQFLKSEVMYIGHSVEENAYAPITMDGSIIVSNVLASSYTKSIQNARRLHQSAAVFRGISRVDTNFAAALTDFCYNGIFKTMQFLHLDFVVNYYSTPCILASLLFISLKSVCFVF